VAIHSCDTKLLLNQRFCGHHNSPASYPSCHLDFNSTPTHSCTCAHSYS